jgi:hypothetical protein
VDFYFHSSRTRQRQPVRNSTFQSPFSPAPDPSSHASKRTTHGGSGETRNGSRASHWARCECGGETIEGSVWEVSEASFSGASWLNRRDRVGWGGGRRFGVRRPSTSGGGGVCYGFKAPVSIDFRHRNTIALTKILQFVGIRPVGIGFRRTFKAWRQAALLPDNMDMDDQMKMYMALKRLYNGRISPGMFKSFARTAKGCGGGCQRDLGTRNITDTLALLPPPTSYSLYATFW